MHTAIVLIYVQFFCIAILLDSVNCDKFSLKSLYNNMLLNREVGCTAVCMELNVTALLANCYEQCKMSDQMVKFQEVNSNETIRLICREDDSLIIKVNSNMIESINNKNQRQYNGSLFLFQLKENKKEWSSQRIVFIADSSIVHVNNLTPNTSYDVTVIIFMGNFEYRHLSDIQSFTTLPNNMYIPKTISNDTIKLDYRPQNKSEKLLTIIKWKPAEDMICNYYIHLYATSEDTYAALPTSIYRKLQPSELYEMKTDILKYETDYTLEIYGQNAKNEIKEGNKCIFEFTTPNCYEVHGYNLQKCRPLPLLSINSTYEMIQNNFYRINVTWNLPAHLPDYYNVSLNLYSKGVFVSSNISGSDNFAFFPEVDIFDVDYDVTIVAYSLGGQTANPTAYFTLDIDHSGQYEQIIIAIGIISPFVALLSISLIFVVIQNHRNRLKHKKEIFSKDVHLKNLLHSYNKDEMEIEPANVELYEVLGEGAFGIVRKGLLKSENKAIAVKMLKENAGIEDIKGFLSEITIMKSVGHHENIIGIVGHSTKLPNKMMLFTEYCSEGNLLNYLRKFRDAFSQEIFYSTAQTDVVASSSFDKSPENIFNFDSNLIDKLTLKDKTILFIDANQPKHILAETNIISNRLYDEHSVNDDSMCEKQRTYNISYENESNIGSKMNECNCTNLNELNRRDKNVPTSVNRLIQKSGNIVADPKVLLFVENQAYDILLSSENSINVKSFEKSKIEMISTKDDAQRLNESIPYLTARDLLLFAKQTASGMEFLANKKIVHRDLAARNVLVCTDKTVKIADFGLSRDIYVDSIYMKSSAGRLPIKWLALESMIDQIYSSQSDVWSYGILLYEIVTLGSTPYPTVPVDFLVNYLKSGNRMSKPHNCSQEFYDLMFSCWHCEPGDRPTFTEILRKIEWFIHQIDINGAFRVI